MVKVLSVFLVSIVTLTATCLAAGLSMPTSDRAQKVINREAPRLKKELRKVDCYLGSPIFIRIFKLEKVLELWVKNSHQYRHFKSYPVCTYGNRQLGPKIEQGDGRAPEGFYYVAPYSLNPVSNFHLAFNLGFPNTYDRVHKRFGSALMVHGGCVSIGCYAMTHKGMDEIYTLADAALKNGQPFFRVHIFPFKMTPRNMRRHRDSKWYPFWENLKQGYDFFEQGGHVPPNVDVKKGHYVFNARYP